MKIKALTIVAMVLLAALLAVGCATTNDTTLAPTATPTVAATAPAAVSTQAAAATNGQLSLTVEELATYNGKNGTPAYIAVNNVIYDVTNNKAWTNGQHEGYEAGTDLTEAIAKAPHGDAVLKDLPVVGAIKTGS